MPPDTPVSALDRFRRIDAMFDAALDLPPDQRKDYLDRVSGEDAELRTEVERLLRAHQRADSFLVTPAAELAGPLFDPTEMLTLAGTPDRIGPWRIVRAIGRGGMGDVYLGERADGQFEQRAAIKVIQHGTPSLVRRFLEERRILALLEHPGIARLIEGGLTPGGLPYFAMELVEGEPVDRYCTDHDLPVARRVELVADVCDAVAYAHNHLVIHRDLKPSNILVTPSGRVKLLDFGIAKVLTEDQQTETQFPAMTPEFAAPEQVRGEQVSTATDVYALGVLLYLLLTGGYPYDVRNKSLSELVRVVSDEEPARPSTRAPEDSRGSIRGDLDLIVMTALQKAPARRYQSPTALAEDLRRLLDGRPILARPDRASYRLRKFVGRHRTGVVLAATVVGLVVAGVARERVLRQRAEIEARKAREVGDYLVSLFDLADPFGSDRGAGGDVSVRTLLDRGSKRVDSTLAGQPEVQAELRGVLGRVYTTLGVYDRATTLLRQTLAQHRSIYGEVHPVVAEDMDRLGDALVQQDNYAEAEPLLRGALEQRRRLLGTANDATAQSLDHLATMYQWRNEYDAAEPLFREALAIRRGLFGDSATAVAESLNNLALLLYQKDEYDQAAPLYRSALAINIRHFGEIHPRTAETLHNLAQTEERLGNDAEAEALYRRALEAKRKTLGNLHPSVTVNLNNLGSFLLDQGRVEEAETLIREALALDRQIFGPRHSYVAASLGNLGTALKMKGDFVEAEDRYRDALEIDRGLFGPQHRRIASDLNNVGNMRRLRGDPEGAVLIFREAVSQANATLGPDNITTVAFTINLGRAVEAMGNAAEAERLLRGVTDKLDTTIVGQRFWYVNAVAGLGRALVAEGRASEARDLLEPTVRLAGRELGNEHVRTADARLALGKALIATHDYESAESELNAAAATLEKFRRAQPFFVAEVKAALGELRRRRGSP
jgi:serine/threonine-protein kinase